MKRIARDEDFAYCAQEVRAGDKDRYLTALFAPKHSRVRLMALYAFNLELARIPETVSEPPLGEIRLEWWRETVGGLYDHWRIDHPVARALGQAIHDAGLPRTAFDNMISARRFDLYGDPVPDTAFLEGYAGETASALIQLASVVLAGEAASKASEAAGHAGVAQVLTGLIRNLPRHRRRGQLYIPADLLAQNGLTSRDVLEGRGRDALSVTLAQLRNMARRHLDAARKWGRAVPESALPAFLPLALVELYLERMERPGFDPYRGPGEVSQLVRQWKLWRAARKGAF